MNENELSKIDQRFQELAELQDGWLDGRGKGYTSEQLSWAKEQVLKLITRHNFPMPKIFPNWMAGMIQLEWNEEDFRAEGQLDTHWRSIEIIIDPPTF